MNLRNSADFPSSFSLLIDRLAEIPSLRDPASRRLCLDLLAEHIETDLTIEDFPATRMHLISIVQACRRQHPEALSALIDVVEQMEPGSLPALRARAAIDNMTSSDLATASAQRDLRTLLRRTPRGPVASSAKEQLTKHQHLPASSLTNVNDQAEKLPRIWGGVPPRNVNFTGRTGLLRKLRDEITNSTTTALLPGALHGMGGIGKSQTAVEYIYRYAADYDVVWWIPAKNLSDIKSSLVELARQLRLPVDLTIDAAVPEVLNALHVGRLNAHWLLVFDNAEHPEDVCEFWPRGGTGHIIVTSRNPHWADVARPVTVEIFERAESCQLLQRRNPGITTKDANRLADALGDLPLAIEQAAAWNAETGMATDEYLALLDNKNMRLLESHAPANYSISVEAAWNVSLTRLLKENPGAFELFKICTFLSPEPISRRIFMNGPSVSTPTEFQSILTDPVKLGNAIREINRYGLAKIDTRTNTLQLHRLVQLVVRNKLAPDEQNRIRHVAHLLLANRDPNETNSVEFWPAYTELVPHILSTKASSCTHPRVRRLVINTIRYLFAFGDPFTSLELARESNISWRENLGEKHEDTLVTAQWWGRLLRFVGRFEEARTLAARTLEMMRDELGDTHEETLMAMNSVASDLRTKGEFDAARRMNEFAYRTAVETLGEDAQYTLAVANNYALSLRLAGQYWAARELDAETITRKINLIGEAHRLTLLTRDNWAVDLRETGDYLRAREEHEDVLHRMRDLLGERHPMTLWTLKNLATSWRMADHRDGVAFRLALESVENLVDRHGESHADSMAAILELSISHRYNGNLTEAHDLGKHIKNLYERNWGVQHPFSLAASTNLAVTSRLLGSIDEARMLNERAKNDMHQILGPDHPFTLACAFNLASDLAASSDHEAAYTLDRETCTRSSRVLGVNHPTTIAGALNVALDLRALNRMTEAAPKRRGAIQLLRQILGAGHPAASAAHHDNRANCDIDVMQI